MAFKLNPSPTFRYPVTLPELQEDGSIKKTIVRFHFKRLETDALQAFQQRDLDWQRYLEALNQAQGDQSLAGLIITAEDQASGKLQRSSAEKAHELLDIVMDWEPQDVTDADGPMAFSAAALEQLLRACPPGFITIRTAFNEAYNGGKAEEERKNLKKPLRTG